MGVDCTDLQLVGANGEGKNAALLLVVVRTPQNLDARKCRTNTQDSKHKYIRARSRQKMKIFAYLSSLWTHCADVVRIPVLRAPRLERDSSRGLVQTRQVPSERDRLSLSDLVERRARRLRRLSKAHAACWCCLRDGPRRAVAVGC